MESQFVENWFQEFARHMFTRPKLWVLAVIPLLAVTFVVILVPPSAELGGWELVTGNYEELLRFAYPFVYGTSVTVPSTVYTDAFSVDIQSSLFLGLVALLIGFMLVGIITRESDDSCYVAGPFAVYSLILILVMHVTLSPYGQQPATLALIGKMLVWVTVSALVAKLFMVVLRSLGLIEMLDDVPDSCDGLAFSFDPARADLDTDDADSPSSSQALNDSPTLTGVHPQDDIIAKLKIPERPTLSKKKPPLSLYNGGGRLDVASTTSASTPGAMQADVLNRITIELRKRQASTKRSAAIRFAVCPFCGSKNIRQTQREATCLNCNESVSTCLELSNNPHCINCDGELIDGAEYCHHCGWK